MTYNDKNFAVANKDASSGAEAHLCHYHFWPNSI